MDTVDVLSYLAQWAIMVFLLSVLSHRRSLGDYIDGNVERLIREERSERIHRAAMAARARVVLYQMRVQRADWEPPDYLGR